MIHHQAPPAYVATAYCIHGTMANGQYTREGSLAVDPNVIRLGTKVRLAAISSTPVNVDGSVYSASDTGRDIRGNRVDIWMRSCDRALKFGRRLVRLFK